MIWSSPSSYSPSCSASSSSSSSPVVSTFNSNSNSSYFAIGNDNNNNNNFIPIKQSNSMYDCHNHPNSNDQHFGIATINSPRPTSPWPNNCPSPSSNPWPSNSSSSARFRRRSFDLAHFMFRQVLSCCFGMTGRRRQRGRRRWHRMQPRQAYGDGDQQEKELCDSMDLALLGNNYFNKKYSLSRSNTVSSIDKKTDSE
jgi:hypothetical protein